MNHDGQFEIRDKNRWSRSRDHLFLNSHVLCQNLAPTSPTMQLYHCQFGWRFRCVMLAATNVAWSRDEEQLHFISFLLRLHFQNCAVLRSSRLKRHHLEASYQIFFPLHTRSRIFHRREQAVMHRHSFFHFVNLSWSADWLSPRGNSPLSVSLMISPGRMSEWEI